MDLFHIGDNPELRGLHRRDDHHTSVKAAASILPKRFTIRQQVEQFALDCGAAGFVDEQLEEEFPHWAPSSWRTRRSELAQENIILDSGRTKRNAAGREMIVWLHRDHHSNPPAKVERQPPQSKANRIAHLEAQNRGLVIAMRDAIKVHKGDAGFCGTAAQMAEILEAAIAANSKGKDDND